MSDPTVHCGIVQAFQRIQSSPIFSQENKQIGITVGIENEHSQPWVHWLGKDELNALSLNLNLRNNNKNLSQLHCTKARHIPSHPLQRKKQAQFFLCGDSDYFCYSVLREKQKKQIFAKYSTIKTVLLRQNLRRICWCGGCWGTHCFHLSRKSYIMHI